MEHKEIEVRFLEVDYGALVQKLKSLGAEELGDSFLEEIIFHDAAQVWGSLGKFVRLRKSDRGVYLTYKNHVAAAIDGTEEIELSVDDSHMAEIFLERVGLIAERHQQKKRHSFKLGEVVVDIDTWPKIPTYVELEGPSEAALREAAAKLGFDWKDAMFEDARGVIEKIYNIPIGTMTWFTFDRFE